MIKQRLYGFQPILLPKTKVMRRAIIFFFLFSGFFPLTAQDNSSIEAIRAFTGAASDEEMDAYEVERLEEYLSRPLRINTDSFSAILSSGLLSQYQAASLMDYRKSSGDVLSLAELAMINGFNDDFVRRLSPFISLESFSNPGTPSSDYRKKDNDMIMRTGVKHVAAGKSSCTWGVKYRLESDGGAGGSFSLSSSYDAPGATPDLYSGNLVLKSRRRATRVVIGDFNARFGQGLALWSGMSMSGLSSLASYSRRGSGISGSWSFSGSGAMTGAAASIPAGNFMISALAAFPGIRNLSAFKDDVTVLPACNLLWYGKTCQLSVTELMEFSGLQTDDPRIPHMKTSLDFRCCIKGTDLFTEAVYDWVNSSPAFLFGSEFPASESLRMAALVRYYPYSFDPYMSAAPRAGSRCSNEYALSLAGELQAGEYVTMNGTAGPGSSVKRHQVSFSIDALTHPESKSSSYAHTAQIRAVLTWQAVLNEAVRFSLRLNERVRNWEDRRFKTDLRMDLTWLSRHFTATARVNVLNHIKTGLLTYLEAGHKGNRLNLFLRQGLFLIDDWDDRIYAYERDAPGNFSVPAYYGRGLWTAFTGSCLFSGWGKLHLRAAITSYPLMEKKKPGKAELKLQLSVSF